MAEVPFWRGLEKRKRRLVMLENCLQILVTYGLASESHAMNCCDNPRWSNLDPWEDIFYLSRRAITRQQSPWTCAFIVNASGLQRLRSKSLFCRFLAHRTWISLFLVGWLKNYKKMASHCPRADISVQICMHEVAAQKNPRVSTLIGNQFQSSAKSRNMTQTLAKFLMLTEKLYQLHISGLTLTCQLSPKLFLANDIRTFLKSCSFQNFRLIVINDLQFSTWNVCWPTDSGCKMWTNFLPRNHKPDTKLFPNDAPSFV